MADPDYPQPSRVVVLLGADMYGALITGDLRKGFADQPVAIFTVFGWVLLGAASTNRNAVKAVTALHCRCEDIGSQLRRFRESEEFNNVSPFAPDHEWCEYDFNTTTHVKLMAVM